MYEEFDGNFYITVSTLAFLGKITNKSGLKKYVTSAEIHFVPRGIQFKLLKRFAYINGTVSTSQQIRDR